MTPKQVKNMLGMTTDKHDAYLQEVIPLFLDFAEDYCNRRWDEPPSGVRLFVAKAVEYNMNPAGLSSRSMDTVSYSYNTDFPESVMKFLRPYRRVRFS